MFKCTIYKHYIWQVSIHLISYQHVLVSDTLPDLELIPYEFQKELAKNAIDGQNVIISSPTGSGKTIVIMYIIKVSI